MKKQIIVLWVLITLSIGANAYNFFHFREEIRMTDKFMYLIGESVVELAESTLKESRYSNSF
jgi:hypothetical protein